MDERKIRSYPPIIVSVVVALILTVAEINSITADHAAEVTFSPQVNSEVAQMEIPLPELVAQSEQPEISKVLVTSFTPEQKADETKPNSPETTYTSLIGSRDWGAEDSEILLKIAMAEAEGESIEGKALVMLVVLNRVWNDGFPGTIEEVVFQHEQFSVTRAGGRYWTTEPDDGCYEALEMVMLGWDESEGALFFESCAGGGWHSKNLEFLFQEGNHKFYR